jgi:hypothetical protein
VDVQLCSFSDLGSMCGWVVNPTRRPLYTHERPGTRCIGGWVGSRAGLDGFGKSRSHRNSIPEPSSPLRVAILTDLSLPKLSIRFPRHLQRTVYVNIIGISQELMCTFLFQAVLVYLNPLNCII